MKPDLLQAGFFILYYLVNNYFIVFPPFISVLMNRANDLHGFIKGVGSVDM
jgi:hypothetical protein